MAYDVQKLDIIHNPKCRFYKVSFNGKCQFDKFTSEVEKNARDKSALADIYSRMGLFDPDLKLPKEKFNHIQGDKYDRNDLYEFKKDQIRVYVILIRPNVYVVYGGYKKEQKKDIARIFKAINTFDENEINIQ